MRTWLQVLTVGGTLVLSTSLMAAQRHSGTRDHWVATWATSEQMAVTAFDKPVLPPNIKMPDFKHMKGVHGPPAIPTIELDSEIRTGG